jgi:hypothetical protein
MESNAMLKFTLLAIHKVAASNYLNFSSGLILLLCGLLESFAAVTEELLGLPIGAHHGIAFFGAIQMLKAIPDFMKGVRFMDDGDKDLITKLSVEPQSTPAS